MPNSFRGMRPSVLRPTSITATSFSMATMVPLMTLPSCRARAGQQFLEEGRELVVARMAHACLRLGHQTPVGPFRIRNSIPAQSQLPLQIAGRRISAESGYSRPKRRLCRLNFWRKSFGMGANAKMGPAPRGAPCMAHRSVDHFDRSPERRVYIQIRGIEQVRVCGLAQGRRAPAVSRSSRRLISARTSASEISAPLAWSSKTAPSGAHFGGRR